MTDQSNLFGEPSAPTDRLFFGVFPPAEVAARLEALATELRQRNGLTGNIHRPDRFHVTLHHLGDWVGLPNDVLKGAMAAAASVACAPFEMAFDRAASFEGRARNRPFVLQGGEGLAGVRAMRQTLSAALARVGQGRVAASPFTPHVTLLYDDKLVAEQAIAPIGWTVRDFALIHSRLGKTEHIPVGRWPLNA